MKLPIAIAFAALAIPALGQDLVLQNATVIDGTGSPPREGVTVFVRGGRITSLGALGTSSPGRSI
jgi:N-acyl-D-aspartate/D-glutamate deacylase